MCINTKRRSEMEREFPDFSGKWKMKTSEHFEELLKALGKFMFITFRLSLLNVGSNAWKVYFLFLNV